MKYLNHYLGKKCVRKQEVEMLPFSVESRRPKALEEPLVKGIYFYAFYNQ